MAEKTTTAATEGVEEGKAAPEQPETDWEAKYREAVAQSRKWEERSKANADKAKEYDALTESRQAAQLAADEAKARADEAEKRLAEANARIERTAMLSQVAKETGVPADLLHGDTVEELTACANGIAAFAASNAKGYPRDKGGAASSTPATRESIESIADPVARIMARADRIKTDI